MENIISQVAAIHDLSGIGRCSLTVVIPILSTMGIQVCPLPTAILSSQTEGFTDYKFIDLTDHMEEYIAHWKSLDLNFDCIYSGFLGSERQISTVSNFIDSFRKPGQIVVVDPVLGDQGELYKVLGQEMIEKMRELVEHADIITPNFTEAAFLLDESYRDTIEMEELKSWILRLTELGPKTVVITSVPEWDGNNKTSVVAYNSDQKKFWKVGCDYIPTKYPGTGDIFTSVLTGSLLQKDSLSIAVDRAVQFVTMAIRSTFGHQSPAREGVLIEKVLPILREPFTYSNYQMI